MTSNHLVLTEKIRTAKTLEDIHAVIDTLPARAESEGGILWLRPVSCGTS